MSYINALRQVPCGWSDRALMDRCYKTMAYIRPRVSLNLFSEQDYEMKKKILASRPVSPPRVRLRYGIQIPFVFAMK